MLISEETQYTTLVASDYLINFGSYLEEAAIISFGEDVKDRIYLLTRLTPRCPEVNNHLAAKI